MNILYWDEKTRMQYERAATPYEEAEFAARLPAAGPAGQAPPPSFEQLRTALAAGGATEHINALFAAAAGMKPSKEQ